MLGRAVTSAMLSLSIAACGAVPRGSDIDRSGPQSSPRPVGVTQEAQLCLAQLTQTGSRYSPLPDRYDAPGCAVTGAVQMSAIRGDGGDLAIANIGPVECETARVFAAQSKKTWLALEMVRPRRLASAMGTCTPGESGTPVMPDSC